jgi:hypothetical protein
VNIVVYLSNYYAVISSGVIGLKNLSIGDNVFPFTVTAQDGTVRSYTLVVVRASNDATLKSLSVKDFPFAGEFHPDTINYRLSLPDSVSAIELSFEPNNPNSTVKITSNVSAIPSGVSTVTVEVTAQDGKTVRTYSVELNKSGEPETHLSTPLSASVVRVSFSGQTLQVNSPVSERVYVYSVAGSLLWRFDKPVGKAFFPISGTRQLLIVKGGSGWTEKMILVGD